MGLLSASAHILIFYILFSLSAFDVLRATTSMEGGKTRHILAPDYVRFQTAGYAGLISAGAVYSVTDWYNSGLSLGYTPEQIGGTEIVSALWDNRFKIFHFPMQDGKAVNYFSDLGLLYGHSKNLFAKLPSRYKKGYYAPTAFRYLWSLGAELNTSPQFSYFAKISYHDVELLTYYHNRESLPFMELGSWGLGVSYLIP